MEIMGWECPRSNVSRSHNIYDVHKTHTEKIMRKSCKQIGQIEREPASHTLTALTEGNCVVFVGHRQLEK